MGDTDVAVIGVYTQGTLAGDALQKAIDRATEALASDAATLAELGLTADEVRAAPLVVKEESGFDPATILIAIGIAVAGRVAGEATMVAGKKAWSWILQEVRNRQGHDAVGDEQTPDQAQEARQPD